MKDYNATSAMEHRLELVGRERLTISGVEDVGRFDETGIVMTTAVGTLVVTGEDLHIDKLSLDGGELHVDGRIDAVTYEEESQGGAAFSAVSSDNGQSDLPAAFDLCPVDPAGPGPPECSTTCCGPSGCAGPDAPACWTGATAWASGRRPSPSCWRRGEGGAAGLYGPGGPGRGGGVLLRLFPRCCGRCGSSGRRRWRSWGA